MKREALCSPTPARALAFILQLDGSRHRAGHLLTYEGLFVFLNPQVVAAWEEGVSISLIKPWQIPEIET